MTVQLVDVFSAMCNATVNFGNGGPVAVRLEPGPDETIGQFLGRRHFCATCGITDIDTRCPGCGESTCIRCLFESKHRCPKKEQ